QIGRAPVPNLGRRSWSESNATVKDALLRRHVRQPEVDVFLLSELPVLREKIIELFPSGRREIRATERCVDERHRNVAVDRLEVRREVFTLAVPREPLARRLDAPEERFGEGGLSG